MKSNNRYFQWVVGERRGEVVIFNDIVLEDGEYFISFKDGSRINEKLVAQINQRDLTGKMMAEVDSPTNIWRFQQKETPGSKPRIERDDRSGETYEVPSVEEVVYADLTGEGGVTKPIPKRKTLELIPPALTPPSHSVFGAYKAATQPEPVVQEVSPEPIINVEPQKPKSKDETDPVYILMSKAKKRDTEITMEMTVSLPPKHLYDIAKESFDEGDTKFIDYIVGEITVDDIKEALKSAIKDMYDADPKEDNNS